MDTQLYQLLDEHETKPVNEIKPTRWIRLEEQLAFIEFLNKVGLREFTNDGKLSACASIVEKYRCSLDPEHSVHVKYRMCGKRGICPRCSKSYAHKRAMIMYSWIKSNLALNLDFDLKMNQIILTLPTELQDMNRKLFVKMIKEMMKQMKIESWGYVIQDDHSDNPLSSTYLHAHILTLNMREYEGRMVQNDYFFDVAVMRAKWKSIPGRAIPRSARRADAHGGRREAAERAGGGPRLIACPGGQHAHRTSSTGFSSSSVPVRRPCTLLLRRSRAGRS